MVSRCTQSSSISVTLSLFFKKIISVVTSVPAFFLNVSFGSLIAPISSALCEIYLLTSSLSLSNVPLLDIKAITPLGLILSNVFPKEIIVY